MNKNQLTYHHKLCESWGWQRHPDNCSMLKLRVHEAIHTIFDDRTPLWRMQKCLIDDKSTYIPEAYELINGVLRKLESIQIEIYKPEIFNPDKFIKKYNQ